MLCYKTAYLWCICQVKLTGITEMTAYRTYSGIEIAFTLLKLAREAGKALTNLQLQKLVYVCHGMSLSKFGRPLIIEDVHAWKYGPVIPSVYFRFKHAGQEPVTDELEPTDLDEKSFSLIAAVMEKFGDLTGWQLVHLTHRDGSPWHTATQQKRCTIDDAAIKQHYDAMLETGLVNCL